MRNDDFVVLLHPDFPQWSNLYSIFLEFFDREQRSKSGLKNYLVVVVLVVVLVVVQYFLN